uniref:Uncharacterized protein n=1 Tax=Arundo donax TaxID=35708 RepID=A0A0A9ALM2_ARUDO
MGKPSAHQRSEKVEEATRRREGRWWRRQPSVEQ